MIAPNIYIIRLSENDVRTYLFGEETSVNIGSETGVPAMITAVGDREVTICTDYFEKVCDDCNRTTCYFNPSFRRRY